MPTAYAIGVVHFLFVILQYHIIFHLSIIRITIISIYFKAPPKWSGALVCQISGLMYRGGCSSRVGSFRYSFSREKAVAK